MNKTKIKSKAYLNWSSGKDAAFTLYKVQQETSHLNIKQLVTTVNTAYNRVSMHGLQNELLLKQAEAIGIPLKIISLHGNISMQDYNSTMQKATEALKVDGFTHSVFGDIFLEDLKAYREAQLEKLNITPVFPLWKRDTKTLAAEIIAAGFKIITVCVNTAVLDETFCGRLYDSQFLKDLPEDVDPCGENGEFHTFVYDGPLFKKPVSFELGDITKRTYTSTSDNDDCHKDDITWDTAFWYADLLPN